MQENLFDPTQCASMDTELAQYESQVAAIKRRLYEGERTQEILVLAKEFNVQVPAQLNG